MLCNQGVSPTQEDEKIFSFEDLKSLKGGLEEPALSRILTGAFFSDLDKYSESDVVIMGGTCYGFATAYFLARSNPNLKIIILEASESAGASAWTAGQLRTAIVFDENKKVFLDEIHVKYENKGDHLLVKSAALFMSTLMLRALEFPNVQLFCGLQIDQIRQISDTYMLYTNLGSNSSDARIFPKGHIFTCKKLLYTVKFFKNIDNQCVKNILKGCDSTRNHDTAEFWSQQYAESLRKRHDKLKIERQTPQMGSNPPRLESDFYSQTIWPQIEAALWTSYQILDYFRPRGSYMQRV